MADPVTLGLGAATTLMGSAPSWLPWVTAGAAAATAGASLMSKTPEAPAAGAPPTQPTPTAPQAPAGRQKSRGMQQSFLSGASQQQGQQRTPGAGKTLVGQ